MHINVKGMFSISHLGFPCLSVSLMALNKANKPKRKHNPALALALDILVSGGKCGTILYWPYRSTGLTRYLIRSLLCFNLPITSFRGTLPDRMFNIHNSSRDGRVTVNPAASIAKFAQFSLLPFRSID